MDQKTSVYHREDVMREKVDIAVTDRIVNNYYLTIQKEKFYKSPL